MTDTQKRVGTAAVAALTAAGIAYGSYSFIGGGFDDCPPWECGGNAAHVVGYAIHLDGERNDDNIRLTGFESQSDENHVRYTLDKTHKRFVDDHGNVAKLDVVDSRFVILEDSGAIKASEELSKLILRRKGKKKEYAFVIQDTKTVQSWADIDGQDPKQFPAYLIESHLPRSQTKKLCRQSARWASPGETPAVVERASLKWHEQSYHAVLLKGERYDKKKVRVNPGDRWVNIACAGSALAKMKLLGYDPETPTNDPLFTTPEQRQATLKMLTATYCETKNRRKFTRDGTPLAWKNAPGWFEPPWKLVKDVEAHWSPDGATCLNTPRFISRKKVVKACGEIPACPSLGTPDDYAIATGEWASFTRSDPAPDVLTTTASN